MIKIQRLLCDKVPWRLKLFLSQVHSTLVFLICYRLKSSEWIFGGKLIFGTRKYSHIYILGSINLWLFPFFGCVCTNIRHFAEGHHFEVNLKKYIFFASCSPIWNKLKFYGSSCYFILFEGGSYGCRSEEPSESL